MARITNTRTLLIDVARKLFAKKGVDNTTMNDVALASNRGRRTIYTYFKSKDELFWSVVAAEQEKIFDMVVSTAKKKLPPDEKIIELIYTRLRAVRETVSRNGTLRAAFFRDIWMVERVRKVFDEREIEIFTDVLVEGTSLGIFDVEHERLLAEFIHYSIKGIEVPFIRGQFSNDIGDREIKRYVEKLVFGALGRKER